MKTINETFTDEEYNALIKVKNEMEKNWHDFILLLTQLEEEKYNEKKK